MDADPHLKRLFEMQDEAKDLLEASGSAFLSAKDDKVVLVMARGEWRDEILRIIEGLRQ